MNHLKVFLTGMKAILLSSRVKSLAWRALMMFFAGTLAVISENLDLLQLNPAQVMVVGLVLGEVSKAINNWAQGKPLGLLQASE